MDNPQLLPIESIHPHPDNPRLVMRDDVVNGIAANIQDGFDPAHALIVRDMGDGQYQIISGHHRYEAAKQAGLNQVPCWIRAMDDDEAYMALVTSNSQGELSPLEIGMHALHCVGLSSGGRGQRGGLRAYAEAIAKDHSNVAKLVSAARVAENCGNSTTVLQDKTQHLSHVHALPEPTWQPMVGWIIDNGATVAQTKDRVKAVQDVIAKVPSWWPASENKLAALALSNPKEASRRAAVFEEAGKLEQSLGMITVYDHPATDEITSRDGRDYYVAKPVAREYDQAADFRAEVIGMATVPSPDALRGIHRRILDQTREKSDQSERFVPVLSEAEQAEAAKREAEAVAARKRDEVAAKVVDADCVDALSRWGGGPIALLLSDPPYGMDFQSNRSVVTAKADKIEGDGGYDEAMKLTADMLEAALPNMAQDAHVILFCNDEGAFHLRRVVEEAGLTFKRILVWVKPNHGSGDLGAFAPRKELAIHAVKGNPKISPRKDDVFVQDQFAKQTDHPTEKPVDLLVEWIECTTQQGDIVVDPFAGTGATLVAAAKIGRECWGCELDPAYHQSAVARLIEQEGLA